MPEETATAEAQAPAVLPEVHYVCKTGYLSIGQGLAYRRGDILPPDVGSIEAKEHPYAVEIRPGVAPAPIAEPGYPMGASPPPIEAQASAVQKGTLNEADVEKLRRLIAEEASRLAAGPDHPGGIDVSDDVKAQRAGIEAGAAEKRERRRREHADADRKAVGE